MQPRHGHLAQRARHTLLVAAAGARTALRMTQAVLGGLLHALEVFEEEVGVRTVVPVDSAADLAALGPTYRGNDGQFPPGAVAESTREPMH